MGAAVLVATITLGALRTETLAVEQLHRESGTPFGLAFEVLQLDAMRVFAGVVAAGTVIGVAFAGRRLAHSAPAGLVAAGLMALDPSLLLEGQLAVTGGFVRFAAVASLALALGGHRAWHWLAPLPIAAGIALTPWFAIWGLAIAAMLWMRGHIYSAPKHLGIALLQGVGIAAPVGSIFHVIAIGLRDPVGVTCGARWVDTMSLRSIPDYGGPFSVPNPVTWYGGGILLLALAAAAILYAATTFRMTRAPGRIQLRLNAPIGRLRGRSLWLLAFAAAAPVPAVVLPLAALALGLAVHHLLKDSGAFGGAIAGAMLLFAVLYLVRFAVLLDPSADGADFESILDLVPWMRPAACGA